MKLNKSSLTKAMEIRNADDFRNNPESKRFRGIEGVVAKELEYPLGPYKSEQCLKLIKINLKNSNK
jgi:ATP-dependent DNA ligase